MLKMLSLLGNRTVFSPEKAVISLRFFTDQFNDTLTDKNALSVLPYFILGDQ